MMPRLPLPATVLRKAILTTGLCLAIVGVTPAVAQEAATAGGIITMEGRGTVSVTPDMAVLTASVVSTGQNAAEALSENSAAIAAVIEAIKAEGIEAKDIQTRGFGIFPRYDHSKSSEGRPEITGYEVRNGVEVNVRDLARLGGLLTLVVDSGANAVDSIRFEVSDPEEKLDEARRKAVAAARHKAGIFAAAAGVDLGAIVSISETGTSLPGPVMMRAEGLMMAKSGPVPVEAGEETIAANVTIRWALK
ncbi:MAG: SIMPL domain-containing protein [Roseibium sp.]